MLLWPRRLVVPILPEEVTGPLDDLYLRWVPRPHGVASSLSLSFPFSPPPALASPHIPLLPPSSSSQRAATARLRRAPAPGGVPLAARAAA